MSKERAAKVMQEIFSKGTYEGDLLGIKITDVNAALDPQFERVSDTPRTDALMGDMSAGWHLRWAESHIQLERELVAAQGEIVRLKGEAESWEKVFDKTCQLLAEEKTALAEAIAKERERCAKVCERNIDAPAGTYQILMAAAKEIRKGE